MKTLNFVGQITSLTAKQDRSLGLRVATPELSSTEKAEFMEIQGMNVQITLKPSDFPNVPEYKVSKEIESKTLSQRLRSVLFLLHSKNSEGYQDFNDYYRHKMDIIIEHLKSKLEE